MEKKIMLMHLNDFKNIGTIKKSIIDYFDFEDDFKSSKAFNNFLNDMSRRIEKSINEYNGDTYVAIIPGSGIQSKAEVFNQEYPFSNTYLNINIKPNSITYDLDNINKYNKKYGTNNDSGIHTYARLEKVDDELEKMQLEISKVKRHNNTNEINLHTSTIEYDNGIDYIKFTSDDYKYSDPNTPEFIKNPAKIDDFIYHDISNEYLTNHYQNRKYNTSGEKIKVLHS